jgi:hypothetical protein
VPVRGRRAVDHARAELREEPILEGAVLDERSRRIARAGAILALEGDAVPCVQLGQLQASLDGEHEDDRGERGRPEPDQVAQAPDHLARQPHRSLGEHGQG